jgi:hypothetical protein
LSKHKVMWCTVGILMSTLSLVHGVLLSRQPAGRLWVQQACVYIYIPRHNFVMELWTADKSFLNIRSITEDLLSLLQDLNIYYRVHDRPPLTSFLSQIYPVHALSILLWYTLILSRLGGLRVTYKAGYWLDDRIYWYLIHTTRGYGQFQFTVTHALVVSW